MKAILVPVDLSPITTKVVAHAAKLARALPGRVVLVTVVVPLVFLKEYAPPPEMLRRIAVGNERAVQRRLATLERQLAGQSVSASSVLLRGSPTQLILDQARQTKADYIVIGSHGHTAFYELIAGGTAHGVLKGATCPVVIVPPQRKRRVR